MSTTTPDLTAEIAPLVEALTAAVPGGTAEVTVSPAGSASPQGAVAYVRIEVASGAIVGSLDLVPELAVHLHLGESATIHGRIEAVRGWAVDNPRAREAGFLAAQAQVNSNHPTLAGLMNHLPTLLDDLVRQEARQRVLDDRINFAAAPGGRIPLLALIDGDVVQLRTYAPGGVFADVHLAAGPEISWGLRVRAQGISDLIDVPREQAPSALNSYGREVLMAIDRFDLLAGDSSGVRFLDALLHDVAAAG